MTAEEEFTEFATGAAPRLRRTAFLLCGNWRTAEDLAETTLAKMFVSWRRINRQDAVYAYANRTLVNIYLADRRRRSAGELLAGWLPERPAAPPAARLGRPSWARGGALVSGLDFSPPAIEAASSLASAAAELGRRTLPGAGDGTLPVSAAAFGVSRFVRRLRA